MLFKYGEKTSLRFPCEILHRIHGGHMAELYMARLVCTSQLVVVKTVQSDTLSAKLLQREAKLLGQLFHKGIPKPYIYEEEKTRCYYIMPYYKGMTLQKHMEQHGPMSEEHIWNIAKQLCEILAYLHSERIAVLHNDITLSNVLLSEEGDVVLLDFGLAEKLSEQRTHIAFQGTLGYTAPECWHRERQKTTVASDIFSFGAVIFALLEGQKPKECYGNFVLSENDLQKKNRWQPVLDHCCALQIGYRYRSISEVYEALRMLEKRNVLKR